MLQPNSQEMRMGLGIPMRMGVPW